ncbi:DUF5655 domain-containing protein [Georgenia satyanarayanai]|uniref:DUF5655 domain-containing protein n=1 Tax=Georgenia satyanarayanai TaxID=860221 RepID=UPI00186B19A7|nr:DUF5655 domain-containing protein [Georgenia satyanarayanai]
MLSIAVPLELTSDRFTEVVHPSAKVWIHHPELQDPSELDAEVVGWLTLAYAHAG